MPAGRPTKYAEDLGEKLISIMSEGLSITAAAAELDVHRDTVYEWAKQHPEFSDSLKMGKGKRVAKLERDLLGAESGPLVTSRIFALKNADPEEWRDKQEHEHTGKDGGPIETVDLSDKEIARRLAFLLTKGAEVS